MTGVREAGVKMKQEGARGKDKALSKRSYLKSGTKTGHY